jgi:long-chain acyl-CoA synthetase
LLASLSVGCTSVVMPFEPDRVLDEIERHAATVVLGLPITCRALVEQQRRRPRHTRSVRLWPCVGDAVPRALSQEFADVFGQPLREVYGLTEVVPITANFRNVRSGSLGHLADGVSVRLLDGAGHLVPPGSVGEIAVTSPGLMIGYWADPVATDAALRDGWLLTGDLAWQDNDGFYWFAGRKKELIIRGGSNVSPQEVEEVLCAHPAVRAAGIVGVPDGEWGERVVAWVVLREGMTAGQEDLVRFVGDRLAAFKVPSQVTFTQELPMTATGKLRRHALKDQSMCLAAQP